MGQDTHVTGVATETSPRVETILRAACRVIDREGPHRLRMATVAQEAGVSKALVHYYFATRQELMRNVFVYVEQSQRDALAVELAALVTGRDKVVRMLASSLDVAGTHPEQRSLWNEVWSGLGSDDELRPLLAGFYADWIDRLSELVGEGVGDGSIAAGVDPRAAGTRLAATADGLDSMLYLGLVGRTEAHGLLDDAVAKELG
jgi:AcrR family transcriptional regulator